MILSKPTKLISYSLYENRDLYCFGMLRNLKYIPQYYPGWEVIVYHDNTVPKDIIKAIKSFGAYTVDCTDHGFDGSKRMFWRYQAAEIHNCDYAIFRDCDSTVNTREALAVNDWINAGTALHNMIDSISHKVDIQGTQLIMGGMCGLKGNLLRGIKQKTLNYCKYNNTTVFGFDQDWLTIVIRNIFESSITEHSFTPVGDQLPFKADYDAPGMGDCTYHVGCPHGPTLDEINEYKRLY